MGKKHITRRDFMQKSAALALAAGLDMNLEAKEKTAVALVRDKNALDDKARVNGLAMQDMLDRALMALTGEKNPVDSMKRLIKPNDIVGIKSNAWSYMPTPAELEQAIERRVMDAGVKKENISIDDRGVRRNPVFQRATAIINVRPVRTHYWAGIGGCIKNMILFSDTPSKYHPDSCADLAQVWLHTGIRDKVKLNILSALTPLFNGRGPHHYDRRYLWDYKGIIAGTDPVAVDTVGLELIKAKRREFFKEDINFYTNPKHVGLADTRHGLGTGDLKKINLIKLGWDENILI